MKIESLFSFIHLHVFFYLALNLSAFFFRYRPTKYIFFNILWLWLLQPQKRLKYWHSVRGFRRLRFVRFVYHLCLFSIFLAMAGWRECCCCCFGHPDQKSLANNSIGNDFHSVIVVSFYMRCDETLHNNTLDDYHQFSVQAIFL